MDINLTTQTIQSVDCDALIVTAAYGSSNTFALSSTAEEVDTALTGLIRESNASGEFKGKAGELLTLHSAGKLATRRVIVVGLGALEKVNTQSIRRAIAIATRHLQKTGAKRIALTGGFSSESFNAQEEAQATVEGALLGLYTFRIYKSLEKNNQVSALLLVAREQEPTIEQALQKARIMAEATNFARTLINEPPNVLDPLELARRAEAMAKEVGLESEIFEEEKIRELKMGGLLAVSQGSAKPPRFIILRYRGGKDKDKGLALVGKGITFDTGGISLKPAAGMEAMKGDMGGAAAVLGAIYAIAQLKPAINVTAIVPTCENMPDGNSYVPGNIVRIMNGKTIEIVNTDAEGRMILADALSYATQEGLSPIVDLATLTGAMVVALGHTMTGFYANDDQLRDGIIAAGSKVGEKYWPMPLDEEYGEYITSEIADIKQTGGRGAGSVTAAKILEHFVGDSSWAHLDIAGTSDVESSKPYQEKGGTGVGVRMLAELAIKLAQQ